MNLAIRGIDYDLGQSHGDTFHNEQPPDLRADYVFANPPFNIKVWEADKLAKDPRWKYGTPPDGNANYARLQHMLARLSAEGRAGIVLANCSMTTNSGGEGEIRAKPSCATICKLTIKHGQPHESGDNYLDFLREAATIVDEEALRCIAQ